MGKFTLVNALIIDWDFFFRIEANWDWAHNESPLMIDGPIWPIRAADFLAKPDGKLPPLEDYSAFWSRFRFLLGTKLYVADSNKWAQTAVLSHQEAHRTGVWLFDQHHDCGYGPNRQRIQQKLKAGPSCENWMIPLGLHAGHKNLHVIYPDHRVRAFEEEPTPFWPDLDRRFYSNVGPGELPSWFDIVFVCRSGAWVPPWHDEEFFKFIQIPKLDIVNIDGIRPRAFDIGAANNIAKAMSDAFTSREDQTVEI